LLSLVKYMCSLLLPYVTLTPFGVPSSTIYAFIGLYINLLISKWHFIISS
jgi:hypothetical protein